MKGEEKFLKNRAEIAQREIGGRGQDAPSASNRGEALGVKGVTKKTKAGWGVGRSNAKTFAWPMHLAVLSKSGGRGT